MFFRRLSPPGGGTLLLIGAMIGLLSGGVIGTLIVNEQPLTGRSRDFRGEKYDSGRSEDYNSPQPTRTIKTSQPSDTRSVLPRKEVTQGDYIPKIIITDDYKIANIKEVAYAVAAHVDLNPLLLYATMQAESRLDPTVISHKGAIGLMQLMPATASEMQIDPYDVRENIIGGARYLKKQLDTFGSVPLALAAYNAGPQAVRRYGGVPPFRETRQYIQRITRFYEALYQEEYSNRRVP